MALVMALLACSCGPNLTPGYRALTLGARIGEQVQTDLVATCKGRRLACEAKHSVGDLRTACELPCLKALRALTVAKASYNAAAEVTWGGLETARLADKGADWLSLLKPGACALLKALGELRPVLGVKVDGWIGYMTGLKGLVCGGVK